MNNNKNEVSAIALNPKTNEIIAPANAVEITPVVKKPYNKRRKRKPIAIVDPATATSLIIIPEVVASKKTRKLNIFKRIGNLVASFLKIKYTQFKTWLNK